MLAETLRRGLPPGAHPGGDWAWLSRKFGKRPTWLLHLHAGTWGQTAASAASSTAPAGCRKKEFRGPPLKEGCTCPGGCRCRQLTVANDEAWGPGNAEWIKKRGGLVTGAQMNKFLSS